MGTPPLQELAHDHRELSGLLVAVHEALTRVERGASRLDDELHELTDGIEAFREALLDHFAREQEGVLPWIASRSAASSARVDELIAQHDRIAETLTAVVKDLGSFELATWSAALARFETLYAEHTQSETAFFAEVAASLADDPAATSQLRELLAER
ncbi:MAG: hemerythrin domain-containing protein [Labilithrix sp.]|nr:hemerythrin domain-containing protein [Labilithrix sp.]MCW5815544.1 hemerythrin domain-containing protein [Labilithrix sp.]